MRDEKTIWERTGALLLTYKRCEHEMMLGMIPGMRDGMVEAFTPRWNQTLASGQYAYSHCTEAERALVDAPLGAWDSHTVRQVSWTSEAAAMLLWSMSLLKKLPEWTEEIVPPETFRKLDPKRIKLRKADEVAHALSLARLWHWRARTLDLERSGAKVPMPPGMTLAEVVANTAALAKKEGYFRPIKDDFPAGRNPYRDLDVETAGRLKSVAQERHRALSWVSGAGDTWEGVPTDT